MKKICLLILCFIMGGFLFAGGNSEINSEIDFKDDLRDPSYSTLLEINLNNDTDSPKPAIPVQLMIAYEARKSGFNRFQCAIMFLGFGWRHMDNEVLVSTDAGVFDMMPSGPSKKIAEGSKCVEVLIFSFPPQFIEDSWGTTTARLQYYKSPITLEDKQLDLIKSFIGKFANTTYAEMAKMADK